ncbi:MAG: hypoxanthine phosphoribosyltransferase [Phycisphaerales bacterium]|nr:hypoxanthine phosphoribosyltransferase [Phycisphaerales bacterium]
MQADIERILLDRDTLARRVHDMARQITADLVGPAGHENFREELTLIPILTGSIIFVADLIRHLPLRMRIRLISVTSYPGSATTSQGAALEQSLCSIPSDLTGAHVLVLDDILDSGQTLRLVCDQLRNRHPASLRTCVLLRKDRPQARAFPVDYVGFDIPDDFVVGYGLDFDGYYRNLPDIVTLRPHLLGQAHKG